MYKDIYIYIFVCVYVRVCVCVNIYKYSNIKIKNSIRTVLLSVDAKNMSREVVRTHFFFPPYNLIYNRNNVNDPLLSLFISLS